MNKKYSTIVAVLVIATLGIIILSSRLFVTIDAGHRGVVFRKFSGGIDEKEAPYMPGFHVIAPWNTMYEYDVRVIEQEEQMEVLTKNGLEIHVELSYRYQPLASEIPKLHNNIGRDYNKIILIPEIRSSVRNVIGKYLPEELYSSKRDAIQQEIFEGTKKAIAPKHLKLDAVLIRSIVLPAKIKTAIERKLEQEQQSKEYEFKLQKESKEAERKRIEAQGIKDFQNIVSEGISDKLLRWKGIEATMELAESSNSKIVIIGSGKDGLPLILGQ